MQENLAVPPGSTPTWCSGSWNKPPTYRTKVGPQTTSLLCRLVGMTRQAKQTWHSIPRRTDRTGSPSASSSSLPVQWRAGLQRWFLQICRTLQALYGVLCMGWAFFSSTGRLSGIRPATDGRRSPRLPLCHEPFCRKQIRVSGCGWRSRFGPWRTLNSDRDPWPPGVAPAACELQQIIA